MYNSEQRWGLGFKVLRGVRGVVTPTDVVSEKARVCRYQSHSWGFVLGLSESEGRRLGGRPLCYPTFFGVVRFSAHADNSVLNHLRASK